MTNALEFLSHQFTVASAIILTVIGALTFMDSRHASASDLQDLTAAIVAEQISRVEFNIDQSERRIKRITRIPDKDRTTWHKQDLEDAIFAKERYLRRLERLQK